MTVIKNYLLKTAIGMAEQSYVNIETLFDKKKPNILLDVGCWDGELTMKWAKKLGANEVWGIEVVPDAIKKAKKAGVKKVFKEDLNFDWSLKSNSVDVIIASQVIEHLWDTDKFIAEIFRVLKPGGYAIVATDNMAGWHNIFSLVMGWQIFPLTGISKLKSGVGNPLALHKGEVYDGGVSGHQRIFTIRALKEIMQLHGFQVGEVRGTGWLPLPRPLANLVLKVDKVHAVSFELKARKPLN